MKPETKRVNIELQFELHRHLRVEAAEKNQTLSEVLSNVITEHKTRKELKNEK